MISWLIRAFDDLSATRHARMHPLTGLDLAIVLLIIAAVVAEFHWLSGLIGEWVWLPNADNKWFQADTHRVIVNMMEIKSDHYRSNVHPIVPSFSLIVEGLTLFGLTARTAVEPFIGTLLAASAATCFLMLRLFDLPRLAAFVFTCLFSTSAAVVFWAPVPELNIPAMLSILLALLLMVHGRVRSSAIWVLVSALTLGVTITNWVAGLTSTLIRQGIKRAIGLSLATLILVLIVTILQTMIFPNARPLGWRAWGEYRYTQVDMQSRGALNWTPLRNIGILLVTTVSASTPYVEQQGPDMVVTNQKSGLTDRSPLGIGVAAAWILLLAGGAISLALQRERRPIAVGVGLIILAQLLLHSVYGEVTFLYVPHILPALVLVAAASWFSRMRWVALALAAFVAFGGGIDNLSQFRTAAQLAQSTTITPPAGQTTP